jgi:hypothetical protein
MWFYVQTGFPLLAIALTAAICVGVVSFINRRRSGSTRAAWS